MPPGRFDLRNPPVRALMYASDLCIVAAGVVIAVGVGRHWAWGPFVVGPLVGIGGVAAYLVLPRVVLAIVRAPAAESARGLARLRERHVTIVPGHLAFGLCCGLIAGSLPSYLPDIVFASMIIVLGIVAPLALLPFLKRRVDQRRRASGANG